MAKLTLANITSGYSTTVTQNANNDLIEVALENTLSRDGTTPNTMGANLDMNNYKVTNLSAPTVASDAARLVDVQAAIAGLPTASTIPNTPAGNIAATNVQAALNELDTEKALLAGSASQTFSVATATAVAHAMPYGQTRQLGYAEITASVAGLAAAGADITGLATTVSVLSGQVVKITAFIPLFQSLTAGDLILLSIFEGASQIQACYSQTTATANLGGMYVSLTLSPSAGSHTYKLKAAKIIGAGTFDVFSSGIIKAFILVEAI